MQTSKNDYKRRNIFNHQFGTVVLFFLITLNFLTNTSSSICLNNNIDCMQQCILTHWIHNNMSVARDQTLASFVPLMCVCQPIHCARNTKRSISGLMRRRCHATLKWCVRESDACVWFHVSTCQYCQIKYEFIYWFILNLLDSNAR